MNTSRAAERMFTARIKVVRTPPMDTATRTKGAPEVAYEQLMVSPIDPISRDTLQRILTESPVDLYETIVKNDDNVITILKGDEVTDLDTHKLYKVRDPLVWPGAALQLVLELQRSS